MDLSPLNDLAWRTSTHSSAESNTCVEVAPVPATWRVSSHSAAEANTCVEVAPLPGARVGVRDTKDRARGAHLVPASAWRAFITALRQGTL